MSQGTDRDKCTVVLLYDFFSDSQLQIVSPKRFVEMHSGAVAPSSVLDKLVLSVRPRTKMVEIAPY